MPNATLLDAFNAASAFARQAMDIAGGAIKEESDAYLWNIQIRLQEGAQNYINDVENGLIKNDTDDYLPGWQTRSQELYNEALKGAKNAYTRKALEYMFTSNDARMRPALTESRLKLERQRADALDADSIARINAGPGDMQAKTSQVQEIIDNQFLEGRASPQHYIAGSQQNYIAVGLEEAKGIIDQAIFENGGGLEGAKEALRQFYKTDLSDRTLDIYDAKGSWENPRPGERPTQGFGKTRLDTAPLNSQVMKAAEKYADEQWNVAVKQEQQKNAKNASELYTGMASAFMNGDLTGALDKAKSGMVWLGSMSGKNGWKISEADNTQYTDKFRSFYDMLTGKLKKTGESSKALSADDGKIILETAFRDVLSGKTPYTILDLKDLSNGHISIVAANAGYDLDDPDSRINIERALNGFWDTFDKVLNSGEFPQWSVAYHRIKNLRTLNKELDGLYKDPVDQSTFDAWLAMETWNLLGSWDFVNGKPQDLDAAVNEMAGQLIALAGGKIADPIVSWFRQDSRQDVLSAIRERNENRYLLETDINDRDIIFPGRGDSRIYQERLVQLDKEEEKLIAGYMGIDTERLIPKYESEGRHERNAARIYQLDGGSTFYKLVPGEGEHFTVQKGKKQDGVFSWESVEGREPETAREASRRTFNNYLDKTEEAANAYRQSYEDIAAAADTAPPGIDQFQWMGADKRMRRQLIIDTERANKNKPESEFSKWIRRIRGEPDPEPVDKTPDWNEMPPEYRYGKLHWNRLSPDKKKAVWEQYQRTD
jgi:hypothetical protein